MALPDITPTMPVSPLENLFNTIADGSDVEFNRRQAYDYRVADNAARLAVTGMRANDTLYQIDTTTQYRYTGTIWAIDYISRRAYTSVLTGITLGTGGTSAATYTRSGDMVDVTILITLGTGTIAVGTNPSFTLPVAGFTFPTGTSTGSALNGAAYYFDANAVANSTSGVLRISDDGLTATLRGPSDSGVTAAAPFTWQVTDRLMATVSYRAASI